MDTDLQRDHEEKVEVGHPLELFEERHGQESQQGVLVAAHQIVLATKNTERCSNDTSNTVYYACIGDVKQQLTLNTEDQRDKYQITEAGRDRRPRTCLTDCRPQRKLKKDFFCWSLWY